VFFANKNRHAEKSATPVRKGVNKKLFMKEVFVGGRALYKSWWWPGNEIV